MRGSFPDAGKVNDYALEALKWCAEKGIIRGNANGMLGPEGTATRAQLAAMLMRFTDAAET